MPVIIPGDGYTLTEYRASIAAKGYDVLDTTSLDVAVNEARRRIFRERRWSWMQAVSTPIVATVGEPVVSMTGVPDILWLDAVRLEATSATYNMDFLPAQEFRTLETNALLDSTGLPYCWTVAGSEVRLYPAPDQAYALTLDFSTLPADLSGASDVDEIPRIYADLVVWAACEDMGFRQRDAWAIQNAAGKYKDLLRMAQGQDSIAQRQSSSQVAPRRGNRGY